VTSACAFAQSQLLSVKKILLLWIGLEKVKISLKAQMWSLAIGLTLTNPASSMIIKMFVPHIHQGDTNKERGISSRKIEWLLCLVKTGKCLH